MTDGNGKNKRMFYNDDWGTRFGAYRGSLRPEMVTDTVDILAGTPVTSLVFCVSYTWWCNFPSQLNPMPGWRDVPLIHTSPLYRNEFRLYRQVREAGWDIPKMVQDRAKELGLEFIPSMRMQDAHFTQKVHPREHPMTGRFWLEHEDLVIGPGEPGPWGDAQYLLDFRHDVIREHILKTALEIIDRYAVDGFEMDWTRHLAFFRRGCERPELLTDLVRRVRRRLDERGSREGRRLPLLVRVAASVGESEKCGLDVTTWIREKLVDVIVPSSPSRYINFELPVGQWLELTRGTGIEVHPSPDSAAPVGMGAATPEMYQAAASNYYAMGADGHRYVAGEAQ